MRLFLFFGGWAALFVGVVKGLQGDLAAGTYSLALYLVAAQLYADLYGSEDES